MIKVFHILQCVLYGDNKSSKRDSRAVGLRTGEDCQSNKTFLSFPASEKENLSQGKPSFTVPPIEVESLFAYEMIEVKQI